MHVPRMNTITTACILLGGLAVAGRSQSLPRSAPEAGFLQPLRLDSKGAQDPLDVFQEWRRANRVTLKTPPPVLRSHEAWKLNHPAFTSVSSPLQPPAFLRAEAAPLENFCPAAGVPDYQGEVAVAVNPYNPRQLVAGANTYYNDPAPSCQAPEGTTEGTIALYGSSDGGRTWNATCGPWPAEASGSVGPVMYGSDPAVSWDGRGNAYAAYMLISQSDKGDKFSTAIVVARSGDAGLTWQPFGVVSDHLSSPQKFDDKDLMAVDATRGGAYSHPDRVYVIWDINNEERVAYSDDGAAWASIVIDPNGYGIGGNLAIGPDGTVYAVWDRLAMGSEGDKLMFSRSTDGGQSWSPPSRMDTHALSSFGSGNTPPAQDKRGVNTFPSIAVNSAPASPAYGAVYVVFCDFATGIHSGPDLDAYLMTSTDGGRTWSDRRRINTDSGGATQFFPWVAADPSTGAVVMTWYDTREDPDNQQARLYGTFSPDGAQPFIPDFPIAWPAPGFANSGVASSDENSVANPDYNANQYGDYVQVAAAGGTAWAAWTDTRQYMPDPLAPDLREDVAVAPIPLGPGHVRPLSPP